MRKFFIISEKSKADAQRAITDLPISEKYVVSIDEEDRNLKQNSAQWPILNAFSDQLLWPVNGEKSHLSPEEWKDVLTSAFRKETRVRLAKGLDGGVVMLGQRTRKFNKKEFSDWLEFLNFVAADRGVKIPVSKKIYEIYGEM